MTHSFSFPFYISPTAQGWAINERDKYGRTVCTHIIEIDDKSIAEMICDQFNAWAENKLWGLSSNKELDGFCNDIYNVGYEDGAKESKFYI